MSVTIATLSGMARELPPDLRCLAQRQSGVVSRSQAIRAGLSPGMIKFRVRTGRWRQLHPGVYATFTGAPGRGARLWAAVLSAGPGAMLSHQTAAELQGLADKPVSPIHVTVPHARHVTPIDGVCLHRSARAADALQEGSRPPRTTLEETVLDLAQAAATFDDVCGWMTRAIARQLTDATGLHMAMSRRPRLRWRADLHELIVAAKSGDHSVLEFRYHRDVEKAHGLPESARQVPFETPNGSRGRRDRLYEPYGVVVELDGRLAHPAENKWKDKTRDNAATAAGNHTLRYGWTQVTGKTCATAAEVVRVLRRYGWDGRPRPCSPGCPVGQDWRGAGKTPLTAASTRTGSVRSGRTTCAPARSAAG